MRGSGGMIAPQQFVGPPLAATAHIRERIKYCTGLRFRYKCVVGCLWKM